MPFAEGTLVTFHLEDGKTFLGQVKGHENGKYTIILNSDEKVEVEETKVHEFASHLAKPGLMDVIRQVCKG